MNDYTDHTHDPSLRSWVESANDPDGDFSIQNLPFGVFRRGDGEPRIGIGIGDQVLDLRGLAERRLIEVSPEQACALHATTLNDLMKQGRRAVRAVRHAVSELLAKETGTLRDDSDARAAVLVSMSDVEMLLPAAIGDYTDFYASIHHATNVGSMFRPDNPLMPNYRHLPVGYHGRASSVVVSGTAIHRPSGQMKADDADQPTYGPCRLLDYELEMGAFIGAGNPLGAPITMREASDHLFGMCIVNDWSARDIQKWEYQPLGPFNAKNFGTTIGPWVVTLDALGPYRLPGPPRGSDDPPMLDYLKPSDDMALDITVEVELSSAEMRRKGIAPLRVSRASFNDMHWTFAQMLAHHTSTGCNMRPGDLIASGTVSGPSDDARGCLLERTWRGTQPLALPDGTQRKFLQDGDEVVIRAYCSTSGAARIGFGECRGVIAG